MWNELYAMPEAKEQLKELAEGRYHHLAYEVTENGFGDVRIRCNVYLEGYGVFSADTWDKAIAKLQEWMKKKPRETV